MALFYKNNKIFTEEEYRQDQVAGWMANIVSYSLLFFVVIALAIVAITLVISFFLSPGIMLASLAYLIFDCSSETLIGIILISCLTIALTLWEVFKFKKGSYIYLGIATFCSVLMVGVTIYNSDNCFANTFNKISEYKEKKKEEKKSDTSQNNIFLPVFDNMGLYNEIIA